MILHQKQCHVSEHGASNCLCFNDAMSVLQELQATLKKVLMEKQFFEQKARCVPSLAALDNSIPLKSRSQRFSEPRLFSESE